MGRQRRFNQAATKKSTADKGNNMTDDRSSTTAQARRAKASQTLRLLIIFILLGSLFAITGVRQFMLDPINKLHLDALWFLLQVAPLLALLPGVMGATRKGFMYCALVSLLYFVHGVMLSTSPELQRLGILEAGFALVLTTVASLAARAAQD